MRKFWLLLLFLAACKQKDVTCKESAVLVPGNIGFYGFNKDDLDTMMVSRYFPDSSFSKFIEADTFTYTHIYQQGGYLYPDSLEGPFMNIDNRADIVIFLPSIAKRYYVHAAYSPPDTVIWTEERGCMGRTFVQGPNDVFINNNGSLRDSTGHRNFYIQP